MDVFNLDILLRKVAKSLIKFKVDLANPATIGCSDDRPDMDI